VGGWGDGGGQGAQAAAEEDAQGGDRVVEREAGLAGEVPGGQGAVDAAGDGPLVAGEDGRAAVEVGQRDGDGVGDTGAGHLLGAAGDLRLHGFEREPDEGRGPVDAGSFEPDVRNRRSARQRRGQREQGVDHRRTQNGLELISRHEPTLNQHDTDITVGLIATAQQITQFGRGLKNAT
jgi:hypothetical protein